MPLCLFAIFLFTKQMLCAIIRYIKSYHVMPFRFRKISQTRSVYPLRCKDFRLHLFCQHVTYEAGSLFELFYRKTASLHSVSIAITGFLKRLTEDVLLKNGKSGHEKIYSGSHFRHGISHKSCVSSFPYSSPNLAGALYAKV